MANPNRNPNLLEQGLIADKKLQALGLVLTQGGEPTFVPHDTKSIEWNTAALGPEKLACARRLAKELLLTHLPGAVVLISSGKQFPGEPLPRWSLGLFTWRDGTPFWKNSVRLHLEGDAAVPLSEDLPQQVLAAIADELQVEKHLIPAYENVDLWINFFINEGENIPRPYYSQTERHFILPSAWNNEMAKEWDKYCARTGWVLPLNYTEDEEWISGPWKLEGNLTLMAGQSAIGLRLPLNRLDEDELHTALTAEINDNHLVLFLPPLPSHLVFLELVQAIETVTEKLNLPPIVLEGYAPPNSPDMVSFSMMSDPGVLEVNLPPAATWLEFDRVVRIMFAAAEKSGLRGHKFQFTGRKVSTGGGAHVVFGGPSLAENPFIKRPAILASLIRFIQNHPCLSYLFTGLFVGPSSQAPRVDESAYEVPYELDLVLQSLPSYAGDAAMIDRMLRNLLMDWNGNTHRAELSVDKFHNPHAPNGRHGLVELRAFEMMPTEEMFLSLNGLLRCLIASFAEQPFNHPLIDWKEQLHDRFALPYFLRTDLQDVIDYLNQRGFAFDPAWFTEHLEFRFPLITSFKTGDVEWELRQAIEPWPVMGEAPMGNGTTARTVDASTDRLQLTALNLGTKGLTAAVNGLMIPLQLQPDGAAVAGIRYRLFNTKTGLQPQVTAHTPLQFTILDTATRKILHAFDYINWKAEKGDYEGLPRTEEEARSRVTQRLIPQPGLLGQQSIANETPRLLPFTLDLRRFGNCLQPAEATEL